MIGTEYTKYEKARMIGARALQISSGAPIMVKTDLVDPLRIAILEFESGKSPLETMRIDIKPKQ